MYILCTKTDNPLTVETEIRINPNRESKGLQSLIETCKFLITFVYSEKLE